MFLNNLFSVETLDDRFVPSVAARQRAREKAGPPRWKSLEFGFYALNFLVFVPLMLRTAASAASPSNPQYEAVQKLLTPGWLGRPVDNTDMQYSSFRTQLPLLALVAAAHILLRRTVRGIKRPLYDMVFNLGFVLVLHGTGALKMLAILMLNYEIGKRTRSRALCWAFAVAILFANELCRGYPLPFDIGSLLSNWEVFFKCTMMRMLGFNLDHIEARTYNPTAPAAGHSAEPAAANTERERIGTPRKLREYSVLNYLAFCLYAPLYLAGPILTFNDFCAQCERRLPSITPSRVFKYALRFVLCLMCMELILHYIPVVAIAEVRAWRGLSPAQVSMVGFFNLVVIWLKLLLPWRFFRLWALLDGIDPPENMVRCVANNYSASSFWRSWHRSFHRWVLRYLYVPLGGSSHQLRNSLLTFAFVAVWHDIQLRLFVWGGLIVLFVVPELVARKLVPASKFGNRKWYRVACGVGGVLNIWMMLIANLVGFAVGPEGVRNLLGEMLRTAAGLRFTIMCSLLLYVGVQVMFEYREEELRRGIDMKC